MERCTLCSPAAMHPTLSYGDGGTSWAALTDFDGLLDGT